MKCARPSCPVEFVPRRHQTFCSAACRSAAHQVRVDRGVKAQVKAVRIRADGIVSVTMHLPAGTFVLPGVEVCVLPKEVAA